MDFYYGMFCGACFFVCLFLAYRIGQKKTFAPAPKETSEEERRKAQRMREAFDDMMKYDVTTALKGRKVH
jgi:hypothetical protein